MELTLAILVGIVLLLFWLPLPRLVVGLAAAGSCLYGISVGLFSPLALFILIILFLMSAFYFTEKKPLFLGIALALLCWALSKHWIPGFSNWLALPRVQLSKNSIPFNIFFNFDKAFVGIALLLFLGQLIPKQLLITLKSNWYLVAGCILALLGSSLALSHVLVDFKITAVAPLWLLNNFLFVCMPEEALFRGFIQKELSDRPMAAIAISSLLFGVYHASYGPLMVLFSTIAGLFYGWIFWKSQRLEASIGLHFLINTLHFFFFTYPRA